MSNNSSSINRNEVILKYLFSIVILFLFEGPLRGDGTEGNGEEKKKIDERLKQTMQLFCESIRCKKKKKNPCIFLMIITAIHRFTKRKLFW